MKLLNDVASFIYDIFAAITYIMRSREVPNTFTLINDIHIRSTRGSEVQIHDRQRGAGVAQWYSAGLRDG
jgi:hypothetical protein